MDLRKASRIPVFGALMRSAWRWDAQQKTARTQPYLPPTGTLLDIGSGPGTVATILRQSGKEVALLDVEDQSFEAELQPVLYDGITMPFADNTFASALLLTVLHHTPNPDQILAEAGRVAQQVIVIEDIYRNSVQRTLTHWTDSLVNLEFGGHPHTNRTDAAWKQTFANLGFRLEVDFSYRFLGLFRQAVYVLAT